MTPSRRLEKLGGGAVNITPGLARVNRHRRLLHDDGRGEERGREGAQLCEAVGIGRLSEKLTRRLRRWGGPAGPPAWVAVPGRVACVHLQKASGTSV